MQDLIKKRLCSILSIVDVHWQYCDWNALFERISSFNTGNKVTVDTSASSVTKQKNVYRFLGISILQSKAIKCSLVLLDMHFNLLKHLCNLYQLASWMLKQINSVQCELTLSTFLLLIKQNLNINLGLH